MRRLVICLRFLQFIGTEFRLVVVAARPCWFCHWMCAAIVSVSPIKMFGEKFD